jgi:hypothetical protein
MVRTTRLPQSLPPLQKLMSQEAIWGFLAELAIAGKNCDVLPAPLATWKNPGSAFSFTELDYARFLPVLDSYTAKQPVWLRYLFLHGIASEYKLVSSAKELREREAEIRAAEALTPARVAFKIRRETKRILRQCQSLFKREESV